MPQKAYYFRLAPIFAIKLSFSQWVKSAYKQKKRG